MGKTRRKLYGKSRKRQRGGGVCKWVLIGAVAALSGAHADDLGFRGRVSNWWYNPKPLDTGPSVELANYIVDMKWMPSLNIYPETCTVPSGIDEAKVVEPYLPPIVPRDTGLRGGNEYSFTKKSSGEVVVAYVRENINPGQWTTDPPIDPKTWDTYEVRGPLPPPKDEFDDEDDDPGTGGKKKRKSRRKTLRRKK